MEYLEMDHKNDTVNHIKSKKLNNQRYVSQFETIFITPRSFCERQGGTMAKSKILSQNRVRILTHNFGQIKTSPNSSYNEIN